MSYALGILARRRQSSTGVRPFATPPTTYDDIVNSFGADVVSYWKFANTGTDAKGIQNATITGSPELDVPTIVDLDRLAEGAPADGVCIAWPGTAGEYAQASHNSAHKTVAGTIAATFQCDSLSEKSTLVAWDTTSQPGSGAVEINTDGSPSCYLRNAAGVVVRITGTVGLIALNAAYTAIFKWGTGGLSYSIWAADGLLIWRDVISTMTDGVAGTSPIRFGAYTNPEAGHHDGPYGRVIWMNRRIADDEEATLARARTINHQAPATGYFVATNGNDANDGSIELPWLTIAHGASQLLPGETLWVRGGRYAGNITLSSSGTTANPITISSYPGEIAVIDASYLDFQSPGGWELDPASPAGTDVYRSLRTDFGTGSNGRGTFFVNDPTVGTVLSGMRQYLGIAKLRSTTYTWVADGTYYGGPGFCFDGGRIYVRVQNLASPRNAGIPAAAIATALGDIRNHPPSSGGFNPNNFVIHLSDSGANVSVSGSYVKLSRLAIYGGQTGISLQSGITDVTVERCRIWGSTFPLNNGGKVTNCTVRWCDIDSGFSPVFSWNEIHTVSTAEHPRQESKIWRQSGFGDTNILFEENLVRACFDGFTSIASGHNSLRILRNTILFLFDDLAQFSSNIENFEVGWNYIRGPGPGYNGGPSPASHTKYWHHNLLELRRGEFGWRLGMEANNGGGEAWRASHNPFASHSVEATSETPIKIFNNTILYRANINNRGARLERIGGKTQDLHEVYNNIAFAFAAHSYVRGVTIGATDQVFDYNLMWNSGAYTAGFMRDWPPNQATDYSSLSVWRASQGFQDTKAVYAPGFEANSKQQDPQFVTATVNSAFGAPTDDYRPSAAGPAASGAKLLASTGWPGADNAGFFGAIDPGAGTGLGQVGIPPGTLIGP